MDKLLPCPFCGSEPKIINLADGYMQVFCASWRNNGDGCGLKTSASDSRDELIAKWNTRHGLSEMRKALEFYADKENWKLYPIKDKTLVATFVGVVPSYPWEIAEEALKKQEKV